MLKQSSALGFSFRLLPLRKMAGLEPLHVLLSIDFLMKLFWSRRFYLMNTTKSLPLLLGELMELVFAFLFVLSSFLALVLHRT